MLEKPPSALGMMIRKKRKALGLTQFDLAELLHSNQVTVTRWERGDHRPRTLKRICRVLGLDYDEMKALYNAHGSEASPPAEGAL